MTHYDLTKPRFTVWRAPRGIEIYDTSFETLSPHEASFWLHLDYTIHVHEWDGRMFVTTETVRL